MSKAVREYDKLMNSIYLWSVTDGKSTPPKSELPECIKERVRWVDNIASEWPLTFSGEIELVLPNPDNEEEVKKRLSPLDDEWLPISQEYKDYYSKNIHFTKTILLEAVVVALIFGLNDEED